MLKRISVTAGLIVALLVGGAAGAWSVTASSTERIFVNQSSACVSNQATVNNSFNNASSITRNYFPNTSCAAGQTLINASVGYLGSRATIYRDNGTLCGVGDWTYNGASASTHTQSASRNATTSCRAGNYESRSQGRRYMSSTGTYTTSSILTSPRLYLP